MLSRRRAVTLLATVVVALAAPAGAHASAQTAACPGADLVPSAGNLAEVSQATLCLLNDERAAAGLRPLTIAPGLTQPSAAYSARMVAENFFAHEGPDGSTLVDRLTTARYIDPNGDWTVGENIAWGQGNLATARNIMVAWMNSPGHRHNILTGDFTQVGVGIVPGTPGDTAWGATYTTDFGNVQGATTAAVATTATAAAKPAARKATKTAKRCKVTTARARAAKAKGKGAKAKRVATCAGASTRATARKAS
ncbi:MAG: hypothetical protein QOH46_2653 [Solirubrobacteraceae bacterium]|jgi:uncharacterized protein YkwD|nr:hypothetical protein [Solirubrobacteraceae bacterium]